MHSPHHPSSDRQDAAWYLAYTKPRQEAVAQLNLEQQSFDAYLPLYKTLKRSAQGSTAVLEPMFPRYVLFRPHSTKQSVSVARSTRGVMTLVSFGGNIATLPDNKVQGIRAIEHSRNQTEDQDLNPLRPGQSVRVAGGVMNGLEGLVQRVSSRRVAVLLHLMGRPTQVQVDRHSLEPVT